MHTAPLNRPLSSYEFPEAFSLLQWHAVKKTAFPWVAIKFPISIHFSYSLTLNPQSSRNKKKNNTLSIINYTLCQYVYDTAFSYANALKLADSRRVQFSTAETPQYPLRPHGYVYSGRVCAIQLTFTPVTYNVLANAAKLERPRANTSSTVSKCNSSVYGCSQHIQDEPSPPPLHLPFCEPQPVARNSFTGDWCLSVHGRLLMPTASLVILIAKPKENEMSVTTVICGFALVFLGGRRPFASQDTVVVVKVKNLFF